MSTSRRYRFTLILAMSVAFVVVALLGAVWPVIGGANPPGVTPKLELASVSVRNNDGRSGFRASAAETLWDLPGVKAVYYAMPTAFMVSHRGRQAEAFSAMVNDRYFRALGVRVDGPGFSRFAPWQRNLQRECVVSVDLQQELSGSPEESLVGSDIGISDETCRVVGVVDSRFAGLRPPMRPRLWVSWPSIIGLRVPDVAPDDYLDQQERIHQLGVVRDRQIALTALEAAIDARLRQSSPEISEVRLLAGDGMEPGPRHRMLREIRLVLMAVTVLLTVILIFALSYALWHGESIRNTQSVRVALGATPTRLIRRAAWISGLEFILSLLVGTAFAMGCWHWLITRTNLSQEYFQLGRSLPASAIMLGGLAILTLATCTWLLEIRVWLKSGQGHPTLTFSRFAAKSWIETATAGFIIAATLVASLVAAWVLSDFNALRSVPRGYVGADLRLLNFAPVEMTGLFQFPQRTRRGHSVDSVGKVLSEWLGTDRIAMSSAAPYQSFRPSQNVASSRTAANGMSVRVPYILVTSNFFRVYGIPFVEGGTFSTANANEVVLSESAARRLLGDPPWLGQELRIDSDMMGPARRVVGVTKDVAYDGRNSRVKEMHYTPVTDMDRVQTITIAGPMAVNLVDADTVLKRIGITDKLEPPLMLRELDAQDDRVGLVRAATLTAACVLAILLGAIGIAELLVVITNRRLPEFALRSALGATTKALAWSLFRAQLPGLLIGVLLGIGLFALAASNMVARGFSVAPPESLSFAVALPSLLVLLVVATIPSLIKLVRIPTALLLKQEH